MKKNLKCWSGFLIRPRKVKYFKIKFMIEYISSTIKRRHFLLLDIQIKINLLSDSVIRNSEILFNLMQHIKLQEQTY